MLQNWHEGRDECVNDGEQPPYMTNNPSIFMHSTIESCCEQNYSWILNTCEGNQGSDTDGGTATSMWYMNWSAGTDGACTQDCSSGGECGGLANGWDILYEAKSRCCDNRKPWDDACVDGEG